MHKLTPICKVLISVTLPIEGNITKLPARLEKEFESQLLLGACCMQRQQLLT